MRNDGKRKKKWYLYVCLFCNLVSAKNYQDKEIYCEFCKAQRLAEELNAPR